jgi:hypothetical protein
VIPADPFALLCLYAERGWALIPVPPGKKGPVAKGWHDQKFCAFDIEPGGNVGIRFGIDSGGLVDIDLDCEEALALADIYLPPTSAVFGRASKPASHRLYISTTESTFKAFEDPIAKRTLLELRADGETGGRHQTIVPPSIAGGEQRHWEGDTIGPAVVDAHVLRRRCVCLAVACLVLRYISATAARKPGSPGWDHPRLLWECDHELGRRAYEWHGRPAPDEPRRHPKPRAECSPLEVELDELARAIPNNCGWNEWNTVGMALYRASGGSEEGFIAFDMFSAKHPAYDPQETAARWANYRRSPPSRIGKGTLIHLARQAGWRPAERAAHE